MFFSCHLSLRINVFWGIAVDHPLNQTSTVRLPAAAEKKQSDFGWKGRRADAHANTHTHACIHACIHMHLRAAKKSVLTHQQPSSTATAVAGRIYLSTAGSAAAPELPQGRYWPQEAFHSRLTKPALWYLTLVRERPVAARLHRRGHTFYFFFNARMAV